MPNRVLRDWTDSYPVNSLSVHAERFFTRLIMKADDYGCYYADPKMIRANLFPLLVDSIREADISRWLAECEKAGLIVLYEINRNGQTPSDSCAQEGRADKYLQIRNFNQRLRSMRGKFPRPPDVGQTPVSQTPASGPPEVETETETESLSTQTVVSPEEKPPPNGQIKKIGSGKCFILVIPPYVGETKLRIAGEDGLREYFEMQGSILNHDQYARKFLRDRFGKQYNNFQHVFNDYTNFVNKQFGG